MRQLLPVCVLVLVACNGSSGAGADGAAAGDSAGIDGFRWADLGRGDPDGKDGAAEAGADACVPECAARNCGPDGCGGSCGECDGGQDQCKDGVCVCQPKCEPGQCGQDGCGGQCGACGPFEVCVDGACGCAYQACGDLCCPAGMACHAAACCKPMCLGKECGDDGCGGQCGTCPEVAPICNQGICALKCDPACQGKECGPDGCGGSCGECGANSVCMEGEGTCCALQCAGKECGPDGCGGSCGECDVASVCLDAGTCCQPSCLGVECGPDGCGGLCAECPEGKACDDGVCVADPAWIGCSDATREGFLSIADYPLLAACGGAWDVPGIHNELPTCKREAGNTGLNPQGTGCTVTDLCAEGWHVCLGKNDVLYRSELGCTDIMVGAKSPAFFLARTSSTGAFNCTPDAIGDPASLNDLFGCGNLGCAPAVESCYPLDRASHDLCKAIKNKPTADCTCYFKGELPPDDPAYQEGNFTDVLCKPTSGGCGWCSALDYFNKLQGVYHADAWNCGTDGEKEAANVVKTLPDEQGGVLCCADQCLTDQDCGEGQTCVMSTCQDP